MPSLGALLVLAAIGGCASSARDTDGSFGPAEARPREPLDRILQLEDARRDNDGELRAYLQNDAPRIRARAALALGRFEIEDFGAPATEALVRALDDRDPRVREQAAFGLGLRGDTTASIALIAHWRDTDPSVRSAVVEAATRIEDRALVPHVLRALEDPDVRVRAAAADGLQRWPWLDRSDASDGDRGLAREIDSAALKRALAPVQRDGRSLVAFAVAAIGGPLEPEDYEVVWRALATLARRGGPSALPAFERWSAPRAANTAGEDTTWEARLFAAQGLARLASHEDVSGVTLTTLRSRLEPLVADSDPRAAVEAVRGLGKLAARAAQSASMVTVLGAALGHPAPEVRLEAWSAIGAFPDVAEVSHLLARYEDEDNPPARAAAIVALARLRGERAKGDITRLAASPYVVERKGAARAAAALATEFALPLLLPLTQDPHPAVAGEALGLLTQHPTEEARRRLRVALEAPDSALRLAAALALRELATLDDVPALQLAALSSSGDAGPEARFEAARTLARVSGDAAQRTLARMAREDSDEYVRRVAAGLLRGLAAAGGREATSTEAFALDQGALNDTGEARVQATIGVWRGPNPRVTFVTNRGDLTFELFPREAPHHVANLLALIEREAYDGTSWHRVVPDFVVQGGDPRGDGNGGGTWRGPTDSLRLEVTRRRYTTGSLGMPRNEDRDSGGCQIFVTHRPTPHLDGRYTIFGELREGFRVLRDLQEGDTILTARRDAPK